MSPVVSILAPGNMGAAVGKRLADHHVEVLTNLDGRSSASRSRALAAGMTAVPLERLASSDFVLSIMPPSAAMAFAEQMIPLLLQAPRKPVFVDCNAVSPKTASEIGALIEATGTPFVDAGIIGLPPKTGQQGPRFYASGDSAARFQTLERYGLDVRVLEAPIGAASALKMSFAGINKGITAIATAMILAATRAGASEALHSELEESWPALLASFKRQVPDMLPKAYRWVAEMREIAEFAGEDAAARELFVGASRLYARIAEDVANGKRESAALAQFFEPLAPAEPLRPADPLKPAAPDRAAPRGGPDRVARGE